MHKKECKKKFKHCFIAKKIETIKEKEMEFLKRGMPM